MSGPVGFEGQGRLEVLGLVSPRGARVELRVEQTLLQFLTPALLGIAGTDHSV